MLQEVSHHQEMQGHGMGDAAATAPPPWAMSVNKVRFLRRALNERGLTRRTQEATRDERKPPSFILVRLWPVPNLPLVAPHVILWRHHSVHRRISLSTLAQRVIRLPPKMGDGNALEPECWGGILKGDGGANCDGNFLRGRRHMCAQRAVARPQMRCALPRPMAAARAPWRAPHALALRDPYDGAFLAP